MAKRILVTGGAGHLGAHLCEKLLKKGEEVICVDHFYTGSRENIGHLLNHPRFEVLCHDICFPLYVDVDEIYNLACCFSPPQCDLDPVQISKTCVSGALNMLNLAKQLKAKILQGSSSVIYGDPALHPQPENYCGQVNPFGAKACYFEGMRYAESLFYSFWKQFRIDIKVARMFNIYGPLLVSQDGNVISTFLTQALKGDPLIIFGSGNQTRSFCYIDDMVDGLIQLMNTPSSHEPLNFGHQEEISILDLAKLIIELTNSPSTIIHEPQVAEDRLRSCPQIEKAKNILNWRPRYSLREGLKKTIEQLRTSSTKQKIVEMPLGV